MRIKGVAAPAGKSSLFFAAIAARTESRAILKRSSPLVAGITLGEEIVYVFVWNDEEDALRPYRAGRRGAHVHSRQASAQVSYDIRTRFALGWGAAAVPITAPLSITAPGTYNFELQGGAFDAVGFTNFGLANWIGVIESSESGLSQPANPRPSPMNQIGRNGVINPAGTSIGTSSNPQTFIDAAHAWEQFFYEGEPPLPQAHGADEYIPIYRFSLTITSLAEREIDVSANAMTTNYVIRDWFIIQNTPPENGEPGFIDYRPIASGTLPTPPAAMTLHVIPAPGAAAVFAVISVGGIVSRRRRS